MQPNVKSQYHARLFGMYLWGIIQTFPPSQTKTSIPKKKQISNLSTYISNHKKWNPGTFKLVRQFASIFCAGLRHGVLFLGGWCSMERFLLRRFLGNVETSTKRGWYCWWKKSGTTWNVKKNVNTGVNYLSTGAGFLPSTVVTKLLMGKTQLPEGFQWDFSWDLGRWSMLEEFELNFTTNLVNTVDGSETGEKTTWDGNETLQTQCAGLRAMTYMEENPKWYKVILLMEEIRPTS